MGKPDLRDLTPAELRTEMRALDEPVFRAGQVFFWLYRKAASSFESMTNIPETLKIRLRERFELKNLEPIENRRSSDGTEKHLFVFSGDRAVEAVRIPSGRRSTICLSTQAGCRFGCAFCASGRHGFQRNLSPSEILGQALFFARGPGPAPTNYVFMGMGEPLDNFKSLEKVLRIMNSPEGMGIAARRMTISTAGLVPGIQKLAGLNLQVNLSVSIHAANDALRSRLMPINLKYPLEDLVAACEDYIREGGRMLTLEYVLLRGVNDAQSDAEGLAGIARTLKAKVNLIAFSLVPGLDFKRPTDGEIVRFRRRLEERKVSVTLRLSKGGDIQAACGQLAGRL
jgi:23S rRNA (adenine2503-C2)-methyltransferase